MVDGIRRYDTEELTVTKTSSGDGKNVVWELCTHAVLWTTISQTLHVLHGHCGLLDIKRSADGYNVQKGRWSNWYCLWQRRRGKKLCGKNVRPLNLHDKKPEFTGIYVWVLQNVHVVNSWCAPTTYDIYNIYIYIVTPQASCTTRWAHSRSPKEC